MTYNEFMIQFKDYISARIELEISSFGTAKKCANYYGASESTISRLRNKVGIPDIITIKKIFGDNILDEEIKSINDIKIDFYEKELARLKRERSN